MVGFGYQIVDAARFDAGLQIGVIKKTAEFVGAGFGSLAKYLVEHGRKDKRMLWGVLQCFASFRLLRKPGTAKCSIFDES
jgi:hypothetical protein